LKEVQFWIEWTLGDGNLDAFRQLTVEGNKRARDEEPGAVSVRAFFSEDGTKCHLYECYADTDAAMAHATGGVAAEMIPKFMALAEMTRIEVHGELSDDLADLLKAFGGVIFADGDGFAR
jgi:quinol monooxygenase YgiN